jgi:hypothetical protein
MRTRFARGICAGAIALALLAGGELRAQTPFVPYYGKNQIRYDRFDWHIYTTDHFEIYYYPQIEMHLERVAGYAESAYQQVSSDLKHELAFKVPLILFKTHSEFEQENVVPGAAQEGVAAFAEPLRNRVALPLDEPPDALYGVIVHELTHIFEFDIIPTSLLRRELPLWMSEGLSEYERSTWDPLDLMTVRDAAVADIVPKMSELEGYGNFNNPRLIYNLGHAAFDFIESRSGKEGIRQFMFALRKSAIGGGATAYDEAFQMKPEEFDQQFDRYLKERFKAFRDRERPADYGRDLSPNPERTHYSNALSIEPSPSGDLIAVATGNRNDQELDIVLVSSKDGAIVRNLTRGFDKDRGFEYIAIPTRFNTVPWMSWSPVGDRLAYFVRTEKFKTLIIQNVLTGRTEQRVELKTLDEPESPCISPDGRTVVFSALQAAVGDIYSLDLKTLQVVNLTKDNFADYAPTWSPDGKFVVYLARVSGVQKLFRLDLDGGKKTQLTFGTQQEAGPKFLDANTLLFPSTATNPTRPLSPEVARNGNIFNLWTLDLQTGQLSQYTDALGGILSPTVLTRTGTPRVAFITYYKGDYSLHTQELRQPLETAASADFGAPGPIIDFQAPLQHTLVSENMVRKRPFEKLFLQGRPPVNVGVSSGGDIFGGTAISFGDVLGDQQFDIVAGAVQQYRTLAGSYLNLSHRFQYALQGFSQTEFFYGQLEGVLYDPALAGLITRDLAVATRTVRGGSVFGIYPLNRYRRLELVAGVAQYREHFTDPNLEALSEEYQQQTTGTQLFQNGTIVPLSAAFVQETTVFREFGPLAGSTVRLGYEVAPKIGNTLSRQTFDGDARYYLRLGGNGVFATRIRAFKSWGTAPTTFFFGGNSEMRGYDYLGFLGQKTFFGNAELRFPLIEVMRTPIGVMGGVRGVFFFDIGGAAFNYLPFTFWTNKDEIVQPKMFDSSGNLVEGPPVLVSGFRLQDGRASYGLGLETFILGFPLHFDWSWKTLFNKDWEDVYYAPYGGSREFRRAQFNVWIGYDF